MDASVPDAGKSTDAGRPGNEAGKTDAAVPCQSDVDCFGNDVVCDIQKHVCVVAPPPVPIRPEGCFCGLARSTAVPLPALALLAAAVLALAVRRRGQPGSPTI